MNNISVHVWVKATADKVWQCWTAPEHIAQWNRINEEWHTPHIENELQKGGKFSFRMETRDGRQGFDYTGRYEHVIRGAVIAYTLNDGRNVVNSFEPEGEGIRITETFDPDRTTPLEEQEMFCQSVLNHFKAWVESQAEAPRLQPTNQPATEGEKH